MASFSKLLVFVKSKRDYTSFSRGLNVVTTTYTAFRWNTATFVDSFWFREFTPIWKICKPAEIWFIQNYVICTTYIMCIYDNVIILLSLYIYIYLFYFLFPKHYWPVNIYIFHSNKIPIAPRNVKSSRFYFTFSI